ncbi:hypothetical protein DL96DRAFT_1619287 [Flagelloscypha sp. PMI_526]|nr:hypothetical protein DL96DRAFT_1619287 [Flagelloscypha sp. PMI_526]
MSSARPSRSAKTKATARLAESDSDSGTDYRPVSKRRKTTHSPDPAAPVKKARGKKKVDGALSKLLQLPLDVLFYIFGHLTPKELVSLARTTKLFRSTLLAPNASTIWVDSRKYLGYECPRPGNGLTETYWAWMIFDDKCALCLTHNVPALDWQWRKRMCKNCFKNQTTNLSKIPKAFPNYKREELVELLVQPKELNYFSNRYLNSDIKEVGDKLNELKTLSRRANGPAKLETYKKERKEFIKHCIEYAVECREWYSTMLHDQVEDSNKLQDARAKEIRRRFKELGYLDVDLTAALTWQRSLRQGKDLSDRSWPMVRTTLERDIKASRAQRLLRDHLSVVTARRAIFQTIYDDFIRSFLPVEWSSLPRVGIAEEMLIFNEVIYANEDQDITQDHFEQPMQQLPSYIKQYRAARSTGLDLVAPKPGQYVDGTRLEELNSQGEPIDPKNLAVTVFYCSGACRSHQSYYFNSNNYGQSYGLEAKRYLFGLEDVQRHPCDGITSGAYRFSMDVANVFSRFCFSSSAASIVARLLGQLGLKLVDVTTDEMDRLDRRWICQHVDCGGSNDEDAQQSQPRKVYSWRAAVMHCMEESGATYYASDIDMRHPGSSLSLLSEAETAKVKDLELSAKESTQEWICVHCPEYYDQSECRELVESHVRDVYVHSALLLACPHL